MKKLLILMMVLSSPAYAGHHDEDHENDRQEYIERSEYYNREDDDREYSYRQRYNTYQLNSWSAFNNRQQSTVNVKPPLDTDGDCRKYKQYSSSGNSVNCDFDGNIQQYKEYSTHKR